MRLKSPKDFKRVFKEGRAIKSPHFVLYICANGLDSPRIGFSFSKSSIKLATRRNRIKRVIREMWRRDVAPNLKGFDMVFVARHQSGRDGEALKYEIKDVFKKVGNSG